MLKIRFVFLFLIVTTLSLAGCTGKFHFMQDEGKLANNSSTGSKSKPQDSNIQVVSSPEVIPVLVNKRNKLPDNFQPKDLIYPDIPFTFEQKAEKRQMRTEAGVAIEKLFAGAKQRGVNLLGVSAYRSHAAQMAWC